MDQGLLLLVAVVIGVFGILFVYKKSMAEIIEAMKKKDYQVVEKAQTQMFIKIAIMEIIPVILVVIAILDMF
ncbi:hypothetical protein AWH56_016255 [Anaerobacillus isosaccharinicus]|uniref:Uncharacterized protein n=1 Tax=Anaerobacillus isosaccharinicus TaxID=1532552 RepID=A0A1S2M378_9BACI|nr:hypothetical protein [Anaerobacillus isosaccharinicus]MBA5587546.1 hypothetical protein [Anaerobacillus isosaccharinicus]QOY34274.1 hypothetical protein AWH56_016255 [Anaerobacillus isosaccharinicus]